MSYNQYQQYDDLQNHTFAEATKLAVNGGEFSHLIKLLSPNNSLRLKIFVQSLPPETTSKTIYGRVVAREALPVKSKKKGKSESF